MVKNDNDTFLKQIIDHHLHKKLGISFNQSLFIAIEHNAIKMVKLLIDNGADVNWINADGYRPLELAMQMSYSEITKLLKGKGAIVVKKLVIGDIVPGKIIIVPVEIEEVKVLDIQGMLDLSQATGLRRIEAGWITGTLTVPAQVEKLEVYTIRGTLDLSQATGLRKLEILELRGATLIVPAGVQELVTRDIENSDTLNLSQAAGLRRLEARWINKKVTLIVPAQIEELKIAAIASVLDLTQAAHLKRIEIELIDRRAILEVPAWVQEIKVRNIDGTLDLSKAINLSDEDVSKLEAKVRRMGKVVRPVRVN